MDRKGLLEQRFSQNSVDLINLAFKPFMLRIRRLQQQQQQERGEIDVMLRRLNRSIPRKAHLPLAHRLCISNMIVRHLKENSIHLDSEYKNIAKFLQA